MFVSGVLSIMTMLTGFLSVQTVPKVIDYANYVNPLRYLARIWALFEFENVGRFDCDGTNVCLYQDGEQVLEIYGFEGEAVWKNLVVLVAITLFYRVVAYLFLRYKN